MKTNSMQLNLIPRVSWEHDTENFRSANLWALALALRYLDKHGVGQSFCMATFGAYTGAPRGGGNLCGTSACAAGFGYQLRIGRETDAKRHPHNYSEYIDYAALCLAPGGSACSVWLFAGGWLLHDNSMTGAANRIGFFLCHPDYIENQAGSGSATEMYEYNYRRDTLFSRWREEFDWSVTPDIPGAVRAAEQALYYADCWIREAQESGRYSADPKTEPPEQAAE